MYVFKYDEIMDTIPLNEQSCWLLGRELAVCDIPIEHPSASKQHAVIQFRYVEKRNEFGDRVGKVKPYLIDLEYELVIQDGWWTQYGESTQFYLAGRWA